MGAASSGANAWLRCGLNFCVPTSGAFQILFSLTLALAVFFAVTDLPATSADFNREAATEHPLSELHEKMPCDEGFVCSAFILLDGLGNGFSDTEYRNSAVLADAPFRHFMTPRVDLPPPRTAA
jgi:hypothetical protein